MEVLISKTAGASYSSSDYDKQLVAMRGTWQKVDTEYLFSDQYNLKSCDLRVMDRHIVAVRNDVRNGKVHCNCCGKQFVDLQAYTNHLEEVAHKKCDCTNLNGDGKKCFWYQQDLVHGSRKELKNVVTWNADHTVQTTEKIEQWEYTPFYCDYKKHGYGDCASKSCLKKDYTEWSPKNVYFLANPNGRLGEPFCLVVKQWKEFADVRGVYEYKYQCGSYRVLIDLRRAEHTIIVQNTKKSYEVPLKDFMATESRWYYPFMSQSFTHTDDWLYDPKAPKCNYEVNKQVFQAVDEFIRQVEEFNKFNSDYADIITQLCGADRVYHIEL